MIGQSISHYKILEKLGGGGMGVVYKAIDLNLDRPVALKFLPPRLGNDPEAKERFIREAKAASALDHPNICTVYEIGETDDGQLFIALAYYRGETLERKLERGPLPVAEAVSYARQIASGLAASHGRDIVHRDVKPDNVLITDDGMVKIFDFGLAKMLGQRSASLDGLTQGTPAYMAPEQIREGAADPRIDLWALGVLLYEALSGRNPFHRRTIPDTVQAIFGEKPKSLRTLRRSVPPALQGIVGQLLEKDPADRYPSCRELLADLDRLQLATPRVGSTRGRLLGWTALIAVGAAIVGGALLLPPRSTPPPPSREAPPAQPPALAVLLFDNLSGDPELDWLRTALADMLVTDLSQSSGLHVLSTRQIHEILSELETADEEGGTPHEGTPHEEGGTAVDEEGGTPNGTPNDDASSFELARQLAERAGVDRVLLGSVAKAGDTLRIRIELQEAKSGEILASRQVEGRGEESLFSLVDDLSYGLRQELEVPGSPADDPDLDVAQITTSSVEALRFYTEGMRLHLQFKEAEATELFHKAVELDPGFAMAWAKLAVTHRNLGRPGALEHAERALEHADRLAPRELAYVRGFYHVHDPRGWGRAIEALERAVELDPDHHAARQNLALLYGVIERYDDAVRHAEELIRRGSRFRGAYPTLAEIYLARGEAARAADLLEGFARRRPEDFVAHAARGWLDRRRGRYDRAVADFDRAEALRPGATVTFVGLCGTHLLQGDWRRAEELIRERQTLREPAQRMAGAECSLLAALFRGRSAEALAVAERTIDAVPAPKPRAGFRLWAARIHLARGEAEAARQQAEAARADGRGDLAEPRAIFYAARAEAARGELDAAGRLEAELGELAELIPGAPVRRLHRHLAGRLALLTGDVDRAVNELEAAAATLPTRGIRSASHQPDHVAVWSSLADAHLAAGDPERAEAVLARIPETTDERLEAPIEATRALHRLAGLAAERGDEERARELDARFLELWGEGDLDRAWVAAARRRVDGGDR